MFFFVLTASVALPVPTLESTNFRTHALSQKKPHPGMNVTRSGSWLNWLTPVLRLDNLDRVPRLRRREAGDEDAKLTEPVDAAYADPANVLLPRDPRRRR